MADDTPQDSADDTESPQSEPEQAPEQVTPEAVTESTPEMPTDAAEVADAAPESAEEVSSAPVDDDDNPESADETSDPSVAAELTLGSGGPADETDDPVAAPKLIRGRIDRFGVAMGTGRRKTAVARVRVKDGTGKLAINGKTLAEYFTIERDRQVIEAPLRATDCHGNVDVWVRVNGGGTTGQAGAIVLGIARALQVRDPSLHGMLSGGGFLTRDGRMVERKKYGYKKARKSFQFSKR